MPREPKRKEEAVDNLKNCSLFEFLHSRPVKRHWSESAPSLLPPLLTGRSTPHWRWKDCSLFHKEKRTAFLWPIPQLSSARMGGALTPVETHSWVRLFKMLYSVVLLAPGQRQWSGLLLECVSSRVWPAGGGCLNRSMPIILQKKLNGREGHAERCSLFSAIRTSSRNECTKETRTFIEKSLTKTTLPICRETSLSVVIVQKLYCHHLH